MQVLEEIDENLPAGHAEQEIAPFTASVLVTLPGEQTAHDV
jgi:hypothetical protein